MNSQASDAGSPSTMSPMRQGGHEEILAPPSRPHSLVRDALEVVQRRLGALRSTSEVAALRAKTWEYLRESNGWKVSLPTVEQRDDLMKRALHLHVEVTKVERETAGSLAEETAFAVRGTDVRNAARAEVGS